VKELLVPHGTIELTELARCSCVTQDLSGYIDTYARDADTIELS